MTEQFETNPVIGISGSDPASPYVRQMVAMVRAMGAVPLVLSNFANRNAEKDIGKIDALIVMGNNLDVDPARYDQKQDPHTKNESDTPEGQARADYEYHLMMEALKSKMPVMGICGGMQRLNVLLGGDLHQDIPELIGHSEHAQQELNIAPFIPVQPVLIDPASMLGKIAEGVAAVYTPAHGANGANMEVINENSMHHQAVKTVGQGLRPAAYAADPLPEGGLLIEGIEADPAKMGDQFILGLQWHPEFGASPLGPKIALRLTQEAAKFAEKGRRVHPPGEAQAENIQSALPTITSPQIRLGSMTDLILRQRAAPTAGMTR
jgi:putative glutamine amidotransferase